MDVTFLLPAFLLPTLLLREDYKAKMPLPVVEGGGGNPAEWAWNEARPWLEKKFKRTLPAIFPADQFIRH